MSTENRSRTDIYAKLGGATRRMRAWIRAEISELDNVKAPEVTDAAIEAFLGDEDLLRLLLRERIQPLVYEMVLEEIKNTRRDHELYIDDRGVVGRKADHSLEIRRRWTRFERWLEYDGMKHSRFLIMDREQLQQAANQRRGRAKTELNLARFLDTVAGGLEDGQKVEDAYSYNELEAIYKQCGN